jgi:phosphate-selective porin OprO and OprP
MLGKTKWLLATSLVASMAFIVPAEAAAKKAPMAKAPTNQELLQRIERLESELAKQKSDQSSTKAKVVDIEAKQKEVGISLDNGRPVFSSGDGRFSLALRARFQADTALFQQSKGQTDLSSGANVRRAYLGIEGKAFKDFWYEFRMNFGGGNGNDGQSGDTDLNLARIAYVGIPHFRINAGVIQPIFTYGDTVSSGQLLFLEKPEIVNIAADSFGGADSRRGIELTYQKEGILDAHDNLIVSAAYTGSKTGTANAALHDDSTNILGRVAYLLYGDDNQHYQLGGSGAQILSMSNNSFGGLSERPESRVDGTKLINTGTLTKADGGTMYGFDAEAQYKNFFLAGEYHHYTIDRTGLPNPDFFGWYAEASWILTGEHKGYGASASNNEMGSFGMPKVVKPFSLSGHSWGAWELAARISQTNLNYKTNLTAGLGGINGGVQTGYAFAVNWYLNQNVRLMLDDTIINVQKSTTVGTNLNNFGGQNLNIISARLQFQM